MLDYADFIARLERLPISEPNHANAPMNYDITDARINGIVRSLYWAARIRFRVLRRLGSCSVESVTCGGFGADCAHLAHRPGAGTGTARPRVLPLRERLQHLCRKRTRGGAVNRIKGALSARIG